MRRRLLLAGAALAGLLAWWVWPASEAVATRVEATPPTARAPAAPAASGPAPALPPWATPEQLARAEQRRLALAQLERAETSLAHYRQATRYPHESRPIGEHPDQVHPFEPVRETSPLRFPGQKGAAAGVRVVSTQDRVFMSGEERVRFTVSAQDDAGQTLPLLVTRAVVFDLPDPRQVAGRPPLALDFREPLRDGVFMAELQPARTAFANFAGTLRTQLTLSVNGQQGVLNLDVIYQPSVPAEWGPISEALAEGSLDFRVALDVRRAGRYVISARVDDAAGQPFALVSFNEDLGAGAQTATLRVFGKLLRDAAPAMPLKLRDVQGFLLLPDTFPDRAMLPRLAGLVHTSQRYTASQFSDAEWQSEERVRYLAELSRDVEAAQQRVARLSGP